jgi:hypothetical protein
LAVARIPPPGAPVRTARSSSGRRTRRIIDVHARRFPAGDLVAGGFQRLLKQRLQRGTFEFLEQVVAGDGLATKTSGVDQPELLRDDRAQLGQ